MGEVVATNAIEQQRELVRVLEGCHSRGIRVRDIRDRLQAAAERMLGVELAQGHSVPGAQPEEKPAYLIAEFDMVDGMTCEALTMIEELLGRLESAF